MVVYSIATIGCDSSESDDTPAEGEFVARVSGSEKRDLRGTATFTDTDDFFGEPLISFRFKTGELDISRPPLPPAIINTGVFFSLHWDRRTGTYELGTSASLPQSYTSSSPSLPRIIQSGLVTLTTVTPNRIAGTFEAATEAASPFDGPVQITGSFIALLDSTSQ